MGALGAPFDHRRLAIPSHRNSTPSVFERGMHGCQSPVAGRQSPVGIAARSAENRPDDRPTTQRSSNARGIAVLCKGDAASRFNIATRRWPPVFSLETRMRFSPRCGARRMASRHIGSPLPVRRVDDAHGRRAGLPGAQYQKNAHDGGPSRAKAPGDGGRLTLDANDQTEPAIIDVVEAGPDLFAEIRLVQGIQDVRRIEGNVEMLVDAVTDRRVQLVEGLDVDR